jgi:D-alanine-D-alanine ligase-like ATP-grasp enzyme
MAALEQIREILSLDYGGVDFALNKDGDILLFEANATMTVNLPDNDERWSYRREPVQRILLAVRNMFLARVAPAAGLPLPEGR